MTTPHRTTHFAFCTYCSESKDLNPELLPAIQRYQCARIRQVGEAAEQAGVCFFILSGLFGLISPERPIPYYDHLLKTAEVPELSERMAAQIREAGLNGIVFFGKGQQAHPSLVPYVEAIRRASRQAGIELMIIEWEDDTMSDWRSIMMEADAAKRAMIINQAGGEAQFELLLQRYPGDGMLYFKRGEAYEALGQLDKACSDFRRAQALFPMAKWKSTARQAIERCGG